MASNLLALTITSVASPLYSEKVQSVTVPGADGEMTVLFNHEALVTTLKAGVITVKEESGEKKEFPIESGVLEISNGQATVLL